MVQLEAARGSSSERSGWLRAGDDGVFTCLHLPEGIDPRAGVVLYPAFGMEKEKVHRMLVALARELAGLGIAAVRFDYRGTGDSGGDLATSGFDDLVADAAMVADTLQRYAGSPPLFHVALRFSALVAVAAAARRTDTAGAILWEPAQDGRKYLLEMLRANIAEQTAEHRRVVETRERLVARLEAGERLTVEGHRIGSALWSSAVEQDLAEGVRRLASLEIPVTLLQLDPARRRPVRALEQIARSSRLVSHRRASCRSPFWRLFSYHSPREPEVFRTTLNAIESGLDGATRGTTDPGGTSSFTLRSEFQGETLWTGTSPEGHTMRGVLTSPTTVPSGPRVGAVLLNSGLLPRYSFHGHYVKMARRLAALGLTVLRVDLPGLGDSGGGLEPAPVATHWARIQSGLHVRDALAAARQLRRDAGLSRVILGGTCGGMATALLAGGWVADSIDGVMGLALPVLMTDPSAGRFHLQEYEQQVLSDAYFAKLLSPRAWLRLARGTSDYRRILSVIGGRLRRLLGGEDQSEQVGVQAPQLCGGFVDAASALLRIDRPVIFVQGGLDPDTEGFRSHFYLPFLSEQRGPWEYHEIPRANHIFSNPRAEEEALDLVDGWIKRRFLTR